MCGSGVAPHISWGFFTVHNRAVREDNANAVSGIRRCFQRIIVIADGAIVFIRFAPAKLFGQHFFDFGAGGECIHQFVVERIFRRISIDLRQTVQYRLCAREHLLSWDLAVGGDRVEIVLPQLADPATVGFTRGRRHIIADKRLYGRLIGPDAEHVRGNFQLIEQGLVVQTVGGKAVQINGTLRREVNFVSKTGEVILPLAEVIAHGKDRFTAVAEFPQCFADILHGRLVCPGKIFQIHHDAGDVAIIFCLANRIHDIEQGVFLQTIGTGAKQLTANNA